MKILFITSAIFLCIANFVVAQDLIVSNKGDSINCKINKVKSDAIYFTFKANEEIRNTLIPVSSVKEYQMDYFETTEVPVKTKMKNDNYPHLRIALNGGYSYEIAKVSESVSSEYRDYVRGLKSGYHLGGDVSYYFSEPLGVGMKYYLFKSSNSLISDGSVTMSDDLKISFVGPAFSTRFFNKDKKNAFLMSVALGYMGYIDDAVYSDDNYKISGGTVGMSYDFGYDIGLSKNISLGFQISFLIGTLAQYEYDDGYTKETIELEEEEYESLNRIDFSIGLRFGK